MCLSAIHVFELNLSSLREKDRIWKFARKVAEKKFARKDSLQLLKKKKLLGMIGFESF